MTHGGGDERVRGVGKQSRTGPWLTRSGFALISTLSTNRAVCRLASRASTAVPSDQQALRTHHASDHRQTPIRGMAPGLRRRKEDNRMLNGITHNATSSRLTTTADAAESPAGHAIHGVENDPEYFTNAPREKRHLGTVRGCYSMQ